MNLQVLLERLPYQSSENQPLPEVHQVKTDSRAVQPGDVFIAITGTQCDGCQFIPQAVQNGAVAVIVEKELLTDLAIPVIRVRSTREAYSLIQQAWYGYPAEKLCLTAVTGSNGKTTVAYLLYALLNEMNQKTGLIGTAGYYSGKNRLDTTLTGPVTTPDPNQLQSILAFFLQNDCRQAVMEASSFGIEQKRIHGLSFDGLIWTNFSPNHHLQYHGTEESYFLAKASLLTQAKKDGIIVLNHDMAGFDQCKTVAPNAVSVGFHPQADLVFQTVETNPDFGISVRFRYQGHTYNIKSPLLGEFQAYNLAQVFLTAMHFGISADQLIETIPNIRQIPGRWEMIHIQEVPLTILIDKANTMVSLEALFKNLPPSRYPHKILVYGQVGGGEASQRKKTGALFADQFDTLILTTDDPENEDPMVGIHQFLEGVPMDKLSNVTIELSREKAIRTAIEMAAPHDLIAVLGRGNQREFLVQGRTEIFDDTAECRKIIRSFGWKV